jgi:hypothetical protein
MSEWLTEGAEVAVLQGGWNESATSRKVERLTKTQAVLDNGRRYNRQTLCECGDPYRSRIAAIDDPKAVSIRDRQERLGQVSAARRELDAADRALRSDDASKAAEHAGKAWAICRALDGQTT